MSEASVTVEQLDSLVRELFERKKEIEAEEEKIAAKSADLEALKSKAVTYLKELERDSYKTEFGTITRSEKWRVKLPTEDKDKAALFEHLRSRGIFEKYATVNSNSLNSLFMQDWEAAKKEGQGITFEMPGIGAPTLFETLSMRKK